MWVSTFHSACVRILRSEIGRFGLTRTFSIYDDADSKRLMQLVAARPGARPEAVPGPRGDELGLDLQERARRPRDRGDQARRPTIEKSYAAAYAEYQRRLTAANALDFDDLIMTTVHLLQAFPDLREQYRRRFRHVLVDEYQDTNHAQYVLIRELCARRRRAAGRRRLAIEPPELMVVGDSDQSIYAFRGATIRNILDFESDFPGARVIMLEQNYRSTQTILNAANAVIVQNAGRKPKKPVVRRRRRRADHRATSPTPSTTRPSSSPTRSTGCATPSRARLRRRGRLLPHQRAVPSLRGGVHPGRAAVQGGRRGPLLRAARGPRRDRLPAGDREPGRRRVACGGS